MFLDLQRQSKHFQKMIRSTSADTAGIGDSVYSLNNKLNDKIELTNQDRFGNYDKMFNTVIASFEKARTILQPTLNRLSLIESEPAIKQVINDITNLINTFDSDKTLNVVEHFSAFLMHANLNTGNEVKTNQIFDTLLSPKSKEMLKYKIGNANVTLPKFIYEVKKLNDNSLSKEQKQTLLSSLVLGLQLPDNDTSKRALKKIAENKFINKLNIIFASEPMTYEEYSGRIKETNAYNFDLINNNNKKLTPNEVNDIYQDFELLQRISNYLGNYGFNLAEDIYNISLATTGAVFSPTSLFDYLPSNIYTDRISTQISAFTKLTLEEKQEITNEFFKQYFAHNTNEAISYVKYLEISEFDEKAKLYPFAVNYIRSKVKDTNTIKVSKTLIGINGNKENTFIGQKNRLFDYKFNQSTKSNILDEIIKQLNDEC